MFLALNTKRITQNFSMTRAIMLGSENSRVPSYRFLPCTEKLGIFPSQPKPLT